ncbi:hypothetical protein TRIATDRAFT_220486 [Trichoderma atroviride IMI 206040]|uniref:Uncharacterized protein n=1 Tax=Hypocrea atroviridis (strain ATCC 20476 / IMI 206040) TaxID=452589 RepID=G9NXE0_HYPAI|nr:uncharacterized protein TRIATDRAFT_220486 [Trichoderma atroviride IMI 206040]EHK44750.1 hypothetical protein TRIATDRAFT_220486 [Trichoderma atroviride IMI 206040]
MSNPEDYTVGWICAIATEYVAARAFLDEKHDGPEYVSLNDNNDYTLGRVGKHNVVIAVLPDGEYGTASAAITARDMLHSFPNVRIGLMVGIGGGAPSRKHDIRLGDIVVSSPRNRESGVFQYDFGKTIQDQSFQHTRFLNQPPIVLRTAINGLKTEYKEDGHQLDEAITSLLENKPRLQKEFKRPDASSDRLYKSDVIHVHSADEIGCAAVCGNEPLNFVPRTERVESDDNPAIHYGTIASADQLMKDAIIRDRLAAEKNVLCFEMEAAGLMNHFPCLVIRGICDYSDSHKNKDWQGYAAMTAAAYAKALLYRIAPNKVEAEKKISVLSGLYEVAREHRDIAKEQLRSQKALAEERLSEKEQKCHQLFRLTASGKDDATYEWYKGRVEERVEGTCLWFLKHEYFQTWLKQESGPLLVTADPGCGKSVLAKYLIDHELPQQGSKIICYFFFKDQDQNTSRQALCALLHQLFSQKPHLIKHAMPQFYKNGQNLINSTDSLWKIIQGAIKDPEAGPIIIVLDALDECAESEFEDLMRNIKSQFHSDSLSPGKLKYLLLCRPYEQIICNFRSLLDAFPKIHIPGEEQSETISHEVNSVIEHRVIQLSKSKDLSPLITNHLEKKLKETPHRTYLWLYLIFDYLENKIFKKTRRAVEELIKTLPKSVNEAYDQVLNKSGQRLLAKKALSIILAASRPLTLSEMNVAMNIDEAVQTIYDLDLEDDAAFKLRLRSLCGLFISIYHGKIYFLHQTAREFLLADLQLPTTVYHPSELKWHQSITTQYAQTVLAELCVIYLDLLNSDTRLSTHAERRLRYSANSAFLDYSATNWGAHFRQACITYDAAILPSALRVCNPDSIIFSVWYGIYRKSTDQSPLGNITDLMIASHYGHTAVVKLLLDKGAKTKAGEKYGDTPLMWAACGGHEAVVKLLLDNGAEIEAKDGLGATALLIAATGVTAERGREAIVKLLLDKGADVEAKSISGQTPLSYATRLGNQTIVKLLLDKGAVKPRYL